MGKILSPDCIARLLTFLADHPDITETRRRKTLSAFLGTHAMVDELEEEIDLPGWTLDTITDLTAAYDDDIDRIRAMPRVTLVEP